MRGLPPTMGEGLAERRDRETGVERGDIDDGHDREPSEDGGIAPPAARRRGARAVHEGLDDRALVARLRGGDDAAAREFFLRFEPLLRQVAARERVQPALRDEVVRDCLADVVIALERATTPAPAHLAAYVAASLRHRVRNDHRRARRRIDAAERAARTVDGRAERAVAEACSEASLRASAGALDEDDAERPPALEGLMRMIESETTDEERKVLGWLAKSVPQRLIAEWVGVRPGAMRARVMRLRARLGEALQRYAATLPDEERAETMRLVRRHGMPESGPARSQEGGGAS